MYNKFFFTLVSTVVIYFGIYTNSFSYSITDTSVSSRNKNIITKDSSHSLNSQNILTNSITNKSHSTANKGIKNALQKQGRLLKSKDTLTKDFKNQNCISSIFLRLKNSFSGCISSNIKQEDELEITLEDANSLNSSAALGKNNSFNIHQHKNIKNKKLKFANIYTSKKKEKKMLEQASKKQETSTRILSNKEKNLEDWRERKNIKFKIHTNESTKFDNQLLGMKKQSETLDTKFLDEEKKIKTLDIEEIINQAEYEKDIKTSNISDKKIYSNQTISMSEKDEIKNIDSRIKHLDETKKRREKVILESLLNNNKKLDEFDINLLRKKTLSSIKNSASEIYAAHSFVFGYNTKVDDLSFSLELGLDLNFSKIGNNKEKEIEIRNKYHLHLSQKLGYSLLENSVAYLTLGFGVKDYNIQYVEDYVNIKNKNKAFNFILGVGYEFKITDGQFSIFFELNNIIPLKKIKSDVGYIKVESYEIKIGAKYYFT